MTEIKLPAGFTPVTEAQPKDDRPVLAIRKSGYVASKFEVLTARYMIDYRPKSPWRDVSLDAVSDSGEPILGWMYADDMLQVEARD